ncbi:TIGR02680 family protein [Siminovitchia sp. 179-K 8D1 HS]|uniref:TIGR02680 family protein n=1 Tax=Siminovitchia sp. 179-K 8D1 HS TaxID=3142385 RepID=UPI00399F5FDC
MEQSKWKMNRAGLVNFWYYDDEIFQFANGKLLLRGSNGSGKSVTMQSLIPVLLDGRKSPDRLDPFGSRARKMEDYLLGEKDVTNRDERTGYLFLEYKREESDQYVTTGIGLRAKRHKSIEFWGFIITDHRRIGKDFFLYKEEKNGSGFEKIPLTKKELEQNIGPGGKVVHTQKEYMDLVNKNIFGFDSLEAYDELIKLIIQLRSPKLSKDFKPTVIYGILESSLPELTDDELRPLSDTIELMDQTKQQLEQLERDHSSLERLCKQYNVYNRYILADKANEYLKAVKESKNKEEEKNHLQQKIHDIESFLRTGYEENKALKQEKEVFSETKRQLEHHEVFQAEEERMNKLKYLEQIKYDKHHKETAHDHKLQKEIELKRKLEDLSLTRDKLSADIEELLDSMASCAEASDFYKHGINAADFKRLMDETYDFIVWKKEARRHEQMLEDMLKKWAVHDREKNRYDDASKSHGEADKRLDEAIREENKWQALFSEEKDALLHAVLSWYENAHFIGTDMDLNKQTSHMIHDLYEPYSYEQVKKPAETALSTFLQKWKNKELQLQFDIQAMEKEKKLTEEDLLEWKNKKDPEPQRHPDTEKARELLKKQGVSFVPFYKAVEFKSNVSEETKERIEAALSEAGLLDALITEKSAQKVHNDKVLVPRPAEGKETLANMLEPALNEETKSLETEINNLLESIVLSKNGSHANASVTPSGDYELALLQGQAPPLQGPRFIGFAQREKYRQMKIAELESELQAILEKLEHLTAKYEEAVRHQQAAKKSFGLFPQDSDTLTAYQEYVRAKAKTKMAQEEKQEKNEKMKEAFQRWDAIHSELKMLAKEMNLDFSADAYQQAKEQFTFYLHDLQELQLTYGNYKNTKDYIQTLQENLEEIGEDVIQLKGELNSLQNLIEKTELGLAQLERRLHELGAEEIRKEIAVITEKLDYIDRRIPDLAGELAKAGNEKEWAERSYKSCVTEIEQYNHLVDKFHSLFIHDLKLEMTSLSFPDGTEPVEKAKSVLKEYGDLLKKETRTTIHDKLTRVFFQEQQNLVEYRLTQEQESFKFDDLPMDGLSPQMEQAFQTLREKSDRIMLKLEFKGQRISPYIALKEVQKDIVVQKEVLNERDRELYEEIILNSVGRIIRGRIHRAERWVKTINHLMENRDPSSGLTFSIRWRPKTADAEEEMDTKDLVDLLRTDPRLLKETDMERVTNHFRSKISRARELAEVEGFGTTLHQVIKDILDYRQWFVFTLYYTREGERKKELTNNDFFKFSGGEKAMAMYIPLFSAAYSRYQEARPDAPYIISLDEAFAGVDENNIRDMFQLVEELNFNYIMNSQALWGDYDTVSKLSIAELVRPKNAPFVTVIRYFWNGSEKRLLFDEYEFEQLKV